MRKLLAVAATLLVSGGALLCEQVWIAAKAALAEVLIDRAFARYLADGAAHPPWSWADTHPIATLEVPRLAVRRTVLAGATGSSLAFGPGHLDGTAPPNAEGNCVLAGHRDTWFAFLEEIERGDEVVVETREGRRVYRVSETSVRSMWDPEVLARSERARLTLVTCYPFGGLARGPLRYVVACEPAQDQPTLAL